MNVGSGFFGRPAFAEVDGDVDLLGVSDLSSLTWITGAFGLPEVYLDDLRGDLDLLGDLLDLIGDLDLDGLGLVDCVFEATDVSRTRGAGACASSSGRSTGSRFG